MAYAIMRAKKHKSIGSIVAAERHCVQREKLRHLVCPEKSCENKAYRKYDDSSIVEIWKHDTQSLKIRKNGVLAIELILTYSPEHRERMCEKNSEWVQSNMKWVSENFGGRSNVLGAYLHMDETTPHLHVFVLPIKDGRLNCREFLGGSDKLSSLQELYFQAMEKYGLERGLCYAEEPSENKSRNQPLKRYYAQAELISKAEKEQNIQ